MSLHSLGFGKLCSTPDFQFREILQISVYKHLFGLGVSIYIIGVGMLLLQLFCAVMKGRRKRMPKPSLPGPREGKGERAHV